MLQSDSISRLRLFLSNSVASRFRATPLVLTNLALLLGKFEADISPITYSHQREQCATEFRHSECVVNRDNE